VKHGRSALVSLPESDSRHSAAMLIRILYNSLTL
jgi:hypothetical protein